MVVYIGQITKEPESVRPRWGLASQSFTDNTNAHMDSEKNDLTVTRACFYQATKGISLTSSQPQSAFVSRRLLILQ